MNLKKVFILFTFLIFSVAIFSCCKKNETKPKSTGSIKAIVSPAGAVTKMQLVKSAATIEIQPKNGDTFLAENLEDGTYLVSFWPAKYFNGPSYHRSITITKGAAVDLDTIIFVLQDTVKRGTMSATINGIEVIFEGTSAEWINNTLWISGIRGYTNGPSGRKDIGIVLQNVTGPGIFSAPSYAGVGLDGITPVSLLWATNLTGGNLSVNLTKLDTINKRVSGEFSFKAIHISSPNSYSPQTVTNGIFTGVLIK